MGVRNLLTYLEGYCTSAIPIESIEELAKSRRAYTDEELVIVVDGLNCIRHIYGNLPWVGGAEFKEYVKYAVAFVEAFRHIGIRLVFFFDGPTVQKKWSTYVERKKDSLKKVYHVLDVVDEGSDTDLISKHDFFILPPAIFEQTQYILQHIVKCEVHQAISECDEEIAKFAKTHDVLGVLGHDTDFVILDIGRAYYFDSDHLDLQTMRTRVYYPQELSNSLGLKKSQLPLLATLMGNDFVRYKDLCRFHYSLMLNQNSGIGVLVPKIASYIQTLPEVFLNNSILASVAKYAFNNSARAKEIKESVLSYYNLKEEEASKNPKQYEKIKSNTEREVSQVSGWSNRWSSCRKDGRNMEANWSNWREKQKEVCNNWREENRREKQEQDWQTLVDQAESFYRENKLRHNVYAVIKGLPFVSYTSFEDYRIMPRDLPIFAELTLSVRQRLYGILLLQKPKKLGSHRVEELSTVGIIGQVLYPYVFSITPTIQHPGLLALWGREDLPMGRLDDLRWTLFIRSISPRLNVNKVRSLPPHLVLPALILHLIVNHEGPGRMEKWEVEVFLATAAVVHRYTSVDLTQIEQDPMTSRSVRIADLVMSTSHLFYDLMCACGDPLPFGLTAPWNFFDGRLFQSKYRQAAQQNEGYDQLCDNDAASLQAFRSAHAVVFSDSESNVTFNGAMI